MPIVSEGGRRGDSGSSGFGRRGRYSEPAPGGGSSSSAPRGSDSRAAVLQCGEMESDEEVQSSFRGAFETMDALQDALPNNRKGTSKFYNDKLGSVSTVADAAHPAQGIANPGNPSPSPKKRKGFLPFSFSWNKSRSKGSSSSRRDASSTSSVNSRNSLSLAPASSSQGNSIGGDERARRWLQRSSSTKDVVSSSPPAGLRSQRIAVQMQSVHLEDVEESTASVSPREKRRKSWE